MTPTDIALLAGELGPIIREYVARAVAPLEQRNKDLELRLLEFETAPKPIPERGEKGLDGEQGDVGVSITNTLINADGRLIVQLSDGKSLDAGPLPQGPQGVKGDAGENGIGLRGPAGQDAPPVDVEQIVGRVLAVLPPAPKGEQGAAGRDAPHIDEDALAARVAALMPVPKDGAPGANGRDGNGIADLLIDRSGALVATFTDGRTKALGLVAGKDGDPGTPGRDGADGTSVDLEHVKALVLGELATWPRPENGRDGKDGTLENLKALYDGERTITLAFKDSGEPIEGGLITLPVTIYRGVFELSKSYQAGDSVTWQGGLWIAKRDTIETPAERSDDWQLSVRRGKDGKSGRDGRDAPALKPTNTPPLYG